MEVSMTRTLFLVALLGAAAPALATPATPNSAQNVRNWEVMLNQYPPRARAAGEQGSVGFKVTLDNDGYATACEVTSSSGFPRLDNETCQLIMMRGTFKGISDANGRKTNGVHQGVIAWQLPKNEAAATAALPTVTASPPEKVICRRDTPTGSLAQRGKRICATESAWRRQAEASRQEWQELQGTKGSTSGH
jgi:TonB family protein